MAVRDDFTAGEVLAAADLNDTFASKPPFAYGTATPTTTVDGFVWFDENSTPPAPKFWDGAAFQTFGGGKILQIVRATDTTDRSTTSTSFVDVTGMTVTITPQKSTSSLLIISSGSFRHAATTPEASELRITDSSNNAISGAEAFLLGQNTTAAAVINRIDMAFTFIGYATPASTSAVTYKMQFRSLAGTQTTTIRNAVTTGQMYAIEVSA